MLNPIFSIFVLNPVVNILSDVIETLSSPVKLSVGACVQVESQLIPTLRYCTMGTAEIAKDAHVVLFGAITAGSLLLNAYSAYKALRRRAEPVPVQVPVPELITDAAKEKVAPIQDQEAAVQDQEKLVRDPVEPAQDPGEPAQDQVTLVQDQIADLKTPETSQEKVEDLQDEIDQALVKIEKPKVNKP